MQKLLSYSRINSILVGPRMEVPSRCPQVYLMLTQMNLGLSPSTMRRKAMGPANPKEFLQHVSVPERTILASLTEPIWQCKCKRAAGKKTESLFVLFFLTRGQWKIWEKNYTCWFWNWDKNKCNPASAANLYSYVFSCCSSMQLFALATYLKIQKKMKYLSVIRSGTM